MNQTDAQTPTRSGAAVDPSRRSLRGIVAAGSTLGAIAGPTYSTLRLGPVVVDGDRFTITVDDVTDAQGLARALGLDPEPWSIHTTSHEWTGHAGGLYVTIRAQGLLPDAVPDRLVADVLGDPTAPGHIRAALAAIPTPALSPELDALAAGDAGRVPVHVLLEVTAIAVAVALSLVLPIGTAAALMGAGFVASLLGAYVVAAVQAAGRRRAHLGAGRTLGSDLHDAALAVRRAARAVYRWARHRVASPEAAYDAQVEPLAAARVLTLSAGEIR